MRFLSQKRTLFFLTLIVLGIFSSILVEISRVHFFHDYLPEKDEGYFAKLSGRSHGKTLEKKVEFTPSICLFNKLLTSIEGSSFLVPIVPGFLRTSVLPTFFSPTKEPVSPSFDSNQARAPPDFSRGQASLGAMS